MATTESEFPTFPADDIPWHRLAAYVAGEASPDDVRAVEAWVAGAPHGAATLAEVRRIWMAAQAEVPTPDVEASLARLRATASAELDARPRIRFEVVSRGVASPKLRALLAAGIAAVVLGGWWLTERRASMDTSSAAHTTASRAYTTASGQRLRFSLPDGSSVLLGPESELHVAADYDATSRVVTLSGEAYFVVAHEARRPFEVRTEYAVTRDLGTAFAVRARPKESYVRVVVAEGEVALSAKGRREVVLRAADIGEVRATGEMTSRHAGADISPALAWTEGRLVFEETRLDQVLAELERWYGVEIHLADARLGARTFTGSFREEPVVNVLEVVRASLGAVVERHGERFVLRTP